VPPSHEFAKTGTARYRKNLPPVQRSRPRRLCRVWMAPLVEERSFQLFAARGSLLTVTLRIAVCSFSKR